VTTSNNANRQIARAAGTVMVAMLYGKLVGLASSILIADAFPAAELDAFFSANRVSETLFSLIAAGALGSAFLPTFTSLLVRNERSSAWKLASAVLNLVTLVLTIAALLACIFAPQIVRYFLAPGFSTDPATFSLTVNLLRIQSFSAVLFGIGGTPEGIIAACAMKCLGGVIQGRLWPQGDAERERALAAGLDLNQVLCTDDLVSGENAFVAITGVTDGELVRGVRYRGGGAATSSLVMRSKSGTIRRIETEHQLAKLQKYRNVDYGTP